MIGGVTFAQYNNLQSVEKSMSDKTYAVIVEAVQERAVFIGGTRFLRGIRSLCDSYDCMMICDEIQCGMGRTGKMFAYENYGVKPDIVTMAKGIGNGMTAGAIATTEKIAAALVPGDHGTTFGGNPLACAAVTATLDEFAEKDIPAHVTETGEVFGRTSAILS